MGVIFLKRHLTIVKPIVQHSDDQYEHRRFIRFVHRFSIISVFDRHTILAWAWRLPFLLGLPMTVAINNMRYAIREPPLKSKSPLDSAWRVLKQPFMKAIPLVSWLTVFGFVLVVWMPS